MAKLNLEKLTNIVENEQIRNDLPSFRVGDNIVVHVKIIEGVKTRIQKLAGLVIRINGGGLNKSFILRREVNGISNEITFNLHSPLITKIEVKRQGKVRRNYLSYIRGRTGKSARIKSALKKHEQLAKAS